MIPCINCNGNGWSRGTERLLSGQLVRRFWCKSCGCRWTIDDAGTTRRSTPPLTDAEILEILTSNEPGSAIAQRLKRSSSLITAIRRGETYRDVHPDVPRGQKWTRPKAEPKPKPPKPQRMTCVQCQHYQPDGHPCSLGLPDPVEEGLRFAAECAYLEVAA